MREAAPYGVTILSDLGVLKFDATMREQHGRTAEVTRHPIEDGADPADFIRQKPATLILTNVHSLTPIDPQFAERDRDRKAYDLLVDILRAGAPVDVVTHLEHYEGFVLVDVGHPVTPDAGWSTVSTLRFEEMVTVTAQSVDVPNEFLAPEVEADASSDIQSNEQDPLDETDEPTRTLLLQIDDETNGAFSGMFGL